MGQGSSTEGEEPRTTEHTKQDIEAPDETSKTNELTRTNERSRQDIEAHDGTPKTLELFTSDIHRKDMSWRVSITLICLVSLFTLLMVDLAKDTGVFRGAFAFVAALILLIFLCCMGTILRIYTSLGFLGASRLHRFVFYTMWLLVLCLGIVLFILFVKRAR